MGSMPAMMWVTPIWTRPCLRPFNDAVYALLMRTKAKRRFNSFENARGFYVLVSGFSRPLGQGFLQHPVLSERSSIVTSRTRDDMAPPDY